MVARSRATIRIPACGIADPYKESFRSLHDVYLNRDTIMRNLKGSDAADTPTGEEGQTTRRENGRACDTPGSVQRLEPLENRRPAQLAMAASPSATPVPVGFSTQTMQDFADGNYTALSDEQWRTLAELQAHDREFANRVARHRRDFQQARGVQPLDDYTIDRIVQDDTNTLEITAPDVEPFGIDQRPATRNGDPRSEPNRAFQGCMYG